MLSEILTELIKQLWMSGGINSIYETTTDVAYCYAHFLYLLSCCFKQTQHFEIENHMNKVIAVVVTYNRLNMLQQCVQHIKGQSLSCDIMIVDNASTDQTAEWCHSILSDGIYYENTGANIGGAGGFNYGMRRAAELGYNYVWIMDDDAFPEADCLKQLIKAGDKLGKFGFLSSIVLWTDGSICRMNWQKKLQKTKSRSLSHITDEDIAAHKSSDDKTLRIQSATFVSLLFPIETIRQAGLPIKEFFIWCDDIEYTRRISLKYNLPCYAVFDSITIHHTAANVGTDLADDDEARIARYNYAFRNENYMYRQYGIKGFITYTAICSYNALKVIKNAKTHKLQRLGIIVKNYFTGLSFNPPIERL